MWGLDRIHLLFHDCTIFESFSEISKKNVWKFILTHLKISKIQNFWGVAPYPESLCFVDSDEKSTGALFKLLNSGLIEVTFYLQVTSPGNLISMNMIHLFSEMLKSL